MINTLDKHILSIPQLNALARLGWRPGVNATFKYVRYQGRWTLVRWEMMPPANSGPCRTTLLDTELLDRLPRSIWRAGTTYALRTAMTASGYAIWWEAGNGKTIGNPAPVKSLLTAAFCAMLSSIKAQLK